MQKLLSLLLFIGVMAGNLTTFAQTPVTVGTGTSASGANVLFSTNTGGNLWSKSASLYTAAEIITAGGSAGFINKIAFNKQGTGEYTFGNAHMSIYIKAVPKTTQSGASLDWTTNLGTATALYTSTTQSFMIGTGWQEFTLQTPFLWDGVSNIEVLTAFHHPTTLTANMTWQYTVATNMNMSRVNSSEVASQTLFLQSNRPNIQFTIAPAGPCTAPPTPGVASASVSTVCPNTDFNLSMTPGSTGTGQTYQWQSAPASTGPWTSIGTPSGSTTLTRSQTATTFYRMAVTCSGQTSYSNAVQVTTNANPVSGTFTIDKNTPASATNFQSFAAAITSLECGGVNGPVTFNVVAGSGPYNELVTIPQVPGTSATSKVTFNGNGNTLTFSNTTTDRAVLRLDGADYITINNLNILAGSLSYGWGIHLLNGANNNTISNNTITIASTSATEANSTGIVFSNSTSSTTTIGNSGNGNIVSGNTIIGGYKGIQLTGDITATGNNQLIGNTIKDFYSYGIEVAASNATLVEGNNISRALNTTTGTFYGIYLSGGSISTQVSKNRIHNTNDANSAGTVYGLYIIDCDAPVGSENVFSNNLLYNFNTTGAIYAIYNNDSNGAKFYHNTVNLDHLANTGITRGFYQLTAATNIDFVNNIIVIKAGTTGVKHSIYFGTAGSTITSNGNVFFLSGGAATSGIGYSGSSKATLADWQTATNQDANSLVADPQFAGIATGDFTPTNVAVNNAGRSSTGIATDINGLTRNQSFPDPGAYEFMNNTIDVGISAITSPNSSCGLTATETITIVVTNFGTAPQSNIPVSYTINAGTPVTATIPGPLAPGTSFTYSFTTQVDLSAQGGYTILAQTSLTGDMVANNNSTTKVVANSRFATLPQLNFETTTTGLASMRLVTNSNSNAMENAAASNGTGSTKGLIFDGITNPVWTIPAATLDPWTTNPNHFAAAYICFNPAGGNPNDPLWLSFDLKQTYKAANANTNFRVTVNGMQVGPTYRPPFTGTPINWQKIYVDLTPYKGLLSIEIGFESNVMQEYANGAGTANLIDNVQVVRLNPTGVKENVLASSLNVFPNPSAGTFTVALPQGKAFEMEVTDLTGKVVMKQSVKSNSAQVDLKNTAKGIYLLKVTSEGKTAMKKLVIQ